MNLLCAPMKLVNALINLYFCALMNLVDALMDLFLCALMNLINVLMDLFLCALMNLPLCPDERAIVDALMRPLLCCNEPSHCSFSALKDIIYVLMNLCFTSELTSETQRQAHHYFVLHSTLLFVL